MILLIRAIKSNSFWILSAEENFVIKEESVLFFVEKNVRILCTAKDSHIFSTKNNSVFVTLADICLTKFMS